MEQGSTLLEENDRGHMIQALAINCYLIYVGSECV